MAIVIVLLLVFIAYQLFISNALKRESMMTDADRDHLYREEKRKREDRYNKRLKTEKGKKRQEYEKQHPEVAKKYFKYGDIKLKEWIINNQDK